MIGLASAALDRSPASINLVLPASLLWAYRRRGCKAVEPYRIVQISTVRRDIAATNPGSINAQVRSRLMARLMKPRAGRFLIIAQMFFRFICAA